MVLSRWKIVSDKALIFPIPDRKATHRVVRVTNGTTILVDAEKTDKSTIWLRLRDGSGWICNHANYSPWADPLEPRIPIDDAVTSWKIISWYDGTPKDTETAKIATQECIVVDGDPRILLHRACGGQVWQRTEKQVKAVPAYAPRWKVVSSAELFILHAPANSPAKAQKTGKRLRKGDIVQVDHENLVMSENGEPIIWLHLADGRGWIFNQWKYQVLAYPMEPRRKMDDTLTPWKVVEPTTVFTGSFESPMRKGELAASTILKVLREQLIICNKEPRIVLHLPGERWIYSQMDNQIFAIPTQPSTFLIKAPSSAICSYRRPNYEFLKKTFGGRREHSEKDHKVLAHAYTREEGQYYLRINCALRNDDYEELRQLWPDIQGLMELIFSKHKKSFKQLKEAKFLYRGIEISKDDARKYKVGREFLFPGFTSTSTNQQIARDFAGQNGYIFVISTPQQVGVNYFSAIYALSLLPYEQEYIFYPYSGFKVTEINHRQKIIRLIPVDTFVVEEVEHLGWNFPSIKFQPEYEENEENEEYARCGTIRWHKRTTDIGYWDSETTFIQKDEICEWEWRNGRPKECCTGY